MNTLEPTVEVKKADGEIDLRESLAALEHDQWMYWAKNVSEEENISARKKRWERLFVPYKKLSEKDKDKDREWADKVIALIHRFKKD